MIIWIILIISSKHWSIQEHWSSGVLESMIYSLNRFVRELNKSLKHSFNHFVQEWNKRLEWVIESFPSPINPRMNLIIPFTDSFKNEFNDSLIKIQIDILIVYATCLHVNHSFNRSFKIIDLFKNKMWLSLYKNESFTEPIHSGTKQQVINE